MQVHSSVYVFHGYGMDTHVIVAGARKYGLLKKKIYNTCREVLMLKKNLYFIYMIAKTYTEDENEGDEILCL